MKKFLKTKNFLIFLIVTILTLTFFIIHFLETVEDIKKSDEAYAMSTIESVTNTINLWFEEKIRIIETMAISFTAIQDEDTLQIIIDDLQEELESEAGYMYVGFEDDTFISTTKNYDVAVRAGYQPTEQDWYIEAISEQNHEVVISEPYEDYFTKQLVVTFSKYIGELNGKDAVVAFDVILSESYTSLSELDKGPMEYLFLVDDEGNVVYHPNNEFRFSSEGLTSIDEIPEYSFMENYPDKGEFVKATDYDGVEKYFTTMEVESSGWQVIGVVNPEQIYGQAISSLKSMVPIYLLIIGLIFSVTMMLHKNKQRKELIAKHNEMNIAMFKSSTYILEYDLKTDKLFHSETCRDNFGMPAEHDVSWESFYNSGSINTEDIHTILDGLSKGRKGRHDASFNVRLINIYGEEEWYAFEPSYFYESDATLSKVVYVVKNIEQNIMLMNLSSQDQMTGALNKKVGIEKINEKLKNSANDEYHALFVIDLDSFKRINDDYGHLVGDEVIIELSRLLKSQFRESDIISRAGGDEFVILASSKSEINVVGKAERIIEEMNRDKILQKYNVTISIGISRCQPNGGTYSELFEEADQALYKSKRLGKNRYTIYK